MKKTITGSMWALMLLFGLYIPITATSPKKTSHFFNPLSKLSSNSSTQETLSKIKDFLLQEEQWAFKKLKKNIPGIDNELEQMFGEKNSYYKLDPTSTNLPCAKNRNFDIPPKILKILDKVAQSRNVNPCIFRSITTDFASDPIGIQYNININQVSGVDLLTINKNLLNLPDEAFYVLFHYTVSQVIYLSSLNLRFITLGIRYNWIKNLNAETFAKILKTFKYAQNASNINATVLGAFTNKKIAKILRNSINIYATEYKNIEEMIFKSIEEWNSFNLGYPLKKSDPESNNEIVIHAAPVCSDITKKWMNIIWDAYQGTPYQELLPRMKALQKEQRGRLQ